MKKIIYSVGAIILILVAINIITNGIENEIKDEYYDVMMTVEGMKLDLPIKTGEDMVLNDIQLSGKSLKYIYKTETSIEDMTPLEISDYKIQWKKNVIAVAKNNPNNKSFAHEDIIFHYVLVDKKDMPVLNFEILPNEYK